MNVWLMEWLYHLLYYYRYTVTMYNNSLFLMNDKLTMIIESMDKVPIQSIRSPMYPLSKVHAKGNHTLMLPSIHTVQYISKILPKPAPFIALLHSL